MAFAGFFMSGRRSVVQDDNVVLAQIGATIDLFAVRKARADFNDLTLERRQFNAGGFARGKTLE
jgi:hypothetical protein